MIQNTPLYTKIAPGVLKITGETRLDLLHRMSTQALNGLQSGQGAATILTTDIGRIIDRLIIYADDDNILVLTGEGNGDAIARYLMRFVFFNDDFHIQDVSAETAVFHVYGPTSQEALNAPDLPLHHWREGAISATVASVHRADPIAGDGYYLICKTAVAPDLALELEKRGVEAVDTAVYERLRIESGVKTLGHELTDAYIPLEADLWDDVSFNKGCYIGQEIIARMESRGKLAKRLMKLETAVPVHPGDPIAANGKTVGSITSAAGTMALGYVKTAVLEKNSALMVGETAVVRIAEPRS